MFLSYSLHVPIVGFFTIRQKRIRGGGAFAEGNSAPLKQCWLLLQTWGESTFNDSESDSGRLFDSESESDSSQFGYDSESNSDSSNISISESESDSNFQLLILNYC